MTHHDRDPQALREERDPPPQSRWQCRDGHAWVVRADQRPKRCPHCSTRHVKRMEVMIR